MTIEIQNAVFEAVNDVLNDYQQNGTVADISTKQLNQLLANFDESGFFNLLIDEEIGGAGLTLKQCIDIFLLEGVYALPIAFTSSNLARAWLHKQGLDIPIGSIAIESVMGDESSDKEVQVRFKSERLIETTQQVLVVLENCVFLVGMDKFAKERVQSDSQYQWLSVNLKNNQALAVSQTAIQNLHDMALLASIARTVGAMRQSLTMTLQYAKERSQFGRQLSQFQAIQQQLSVMAECVSSSQMAAELAFESPSIEPKHKNILLAKHEVSLVANKVANIAHALHGAIGITQEFPLHYYTKIMRQQRFLGGSEQFWAERLGEEVLRSDKTLLAILTEDLLAN